MSSLQAFATPALASIVTIVAVLADNFEQSGHSYGHVLPEWSPRFMRPVGDPTGQPSTLDLLLSGMAAAGHGVAAFSFYLGLDEEEVRERAASLGIAHPAEKPLRRPASAKPWSGGEVRLQIALWLENL